MPSSLELFSTACFALAILHTFSVKLFQGLASRYREGSVGENLFHLLGEVEVVFGLWAAIFLAYYALRAGPVEAVHYLESRNFTEPAFVFVIMGVCSTRPVISATGRAIVALSRVLPLPRPLAFYATTLVVGPLLGSFITEPAAMTVTALLLLERLYKKGISRPLMYATLGLLFVSVSIGGTLTPYAAPPVLMVAKAWHWDLSFMLQHFGWKAVVAILLSTALVSFRFRRELGRLSWKEEGNEPAPPAWVCGSHFIFLALIVLASHHAAVFVGIFLFFLGLVSVTKEYQGELKLREGLLVAFFLGGLVVLGGTQRWWLEPLLTQLSSFPLYGGAIALTAITDNAALTYLGAQVPGLSEASRYALVSGAVVGGGLTVIANAPNPAGYGILNQSFGKDGIEPLGLFLAALPPTVVAAACFWFL
jgi:Na+/H+ antiporter NhaD/arsenite permease-like protein